MNPRNQPNFHVDKTYVTTDGGTMKLLGYKKQDGKPYARISINGGDEQVVPQGAAKKLLSVGDDKKFILVGEQSPTEPITQPKSEETKTPAKAAAPSPAQSATKPDDKPAQPAPGKPKRDGFFKEMADGWRWWFGGSSNKKQEDKK